MSIFLRTPQVTEPSGAPDRRPERAGAGRPAEPMAGPASRSALRPSNLLEEPYQSIRQKVHDQLLAETIVVAEADPDRVRQDIQSIYNQVLMDEKILIGRAERDELLEMIVAEILGLGPIE
ncbi:MAG TPA: hypothetical protein VGA61_06945, partial [Anaerolineae bacterium]